MGVIAQDGINSTHCIRSILGATFTDLAKMELFNSQASASFLKPRDLMLVKMLSSYSEYVLRKVVALHFTGAFFPMNSHCLTIYISDDLNFCFLGEFFNLRSSSVILASFKVA